MGLPVFFNKMPLRVPTMAWFVTTPNMVARLLQQTQVMCPAFFGEWLPNVDGGASRRDQRGDAGGHHREGIADGDVIHPAGDHHPCATGFKMDRRIVAKQELQGVARA